jgi:hypothetical protein
MIHVTAVADRWLLDTTAATVAERQCIWDYGDLIESQPSGLRLLPSAKLAERIYASCEYYDNATQKAVESLATRSKRVGQCLSRITYLKQYGKSPDDCSGLVQSTTFPLLEHQKVGVKNALDMGGSYGLWFKMGACKSSTAIAVLDNSPNISSVLVLGPNPVREHWVVEFEKFGQKDYSTSVIRGEKYNRIGDLATARTVDAGRIPVVILGYGTAVAMENILTMFPWSVIILDEHHMCTSKGTNRTDCSSRLAEHIPMVLSLTGTPIKNKVSGLYFLFEAICKHSTGAKSHADFQRKYSVVSDRSGFKVEEDRVLDLPGIRELVSENSMIVKLEDVVDLPQKLYDVVEIEMSGRQSELYKQLNTQLALEIAADLESATESTRSMVVSNVLVKLLRLSQITGGFISWSPTFDDMTGERTGDSQIEYLQESPKIAALVENLLTLGETEKSIVFCLHVPELLWVSEYLKANGISHVLYHGSMGDGAKASSVVSYNTNDSIKVFLATGSAGGTGLTLLGYDPVAGGSCNTKYIEFLSQGWSSVVREQAEGRACRKGTRVSVTIRDYVVPDTIDTQISTRVKRKIDNANDILDVSDILKGCSNE